MRVALVSGLIALIVLIAGGGVGFLFLELHNANAKLLAANKRIDTVSAEARDARKEIEGLGDYITELLDAIDEAVDANAAYAKSNEELQAALSGTQANYDSALALTIDLENRLIAAEGEVSTLNTEVAERDTRIDGFVSNIITLNAQVAERGTRIASLVNDNSRLRADYQTLVNAGGDLAQVRAEEEASQKRVDALEVEIKELQEQRKPLILSPGAVATGGFLCTGSMYPAITCTDRGTWLEKFNPEDIVVGATISFSPNCWEEEPGDVSTAHRVKEIKVENGVYYFWPRGDANREDDGCWVHQDNVDGYLIEIQKNVVPENAYLQSQVRASRVAYDNLWSRYCGHVSQSQKCYLSGGIYDIVRDALNLYNCWLRNAEESKYPGHIPNQCKPVSEAAGT